VGSCSLGLYDFGWLLSGLHSFAVLRSSLATLGGCSCVFVTLPFLAPPFWPALSPEAWSALALRKPSPVNSSSFSATSLLFSRDRRIFPPRSLRTTLS